MEKKTFVYFKSGDGESYITKIFEKEIYGKAIEIELTDELTQKYEERFSREIFLHDHDDVLGYGLIKIEENGEYSSSYEENN